METINLKREGEAKDCNISPNILLTVDHYYVH